MRLSRKLLSTALFCAIFIPAGAVWAGDGVPVTSVTTQRTAAVMSGPYTISGDTITYGMGDNVALTSVTSSGNLLTRSAISKPDITINRKDNVNVSGERLTFFYPGTVSGGSTINIEGDEALSMEQAMNDDYLTSGGLDVFLNVDTSVEKANNIERIDFVVASGIILPTTPALLTEIGTVANEKHGNNTYKIAMITSLDAFGDPDGYGLLKTVQGNVDYGNIGRPQNSSGTNLRNLYMRNGTAPVGGGGNGPVAYIRNDTNFIGLSFVSFGAMGATPGQTVYGYSLFANDMSDTHDLVGLTDAPTNTSGGVNGGDIYGGTFAIFSTPAAETETSEGGSPDLQGNKTVTVYDPTSLGLYNVPGNDVVYSINISNLGDGSPDADSIYLMDSLPTSVEFFNGDVDGPGPETDPVAFIDAASGLSFAYGADVKYSNAIPPPASFLACSYTPAPGYDSNVRHICFRPSGTMAHGAPTPNFSVQFRARIQ